MRRVRRRSISLKLLMSGEGVRTILLLPLVARCLVTMDVCIWRMFVFYVCENVSCVAAVVEDSIFILGVLKYVVCLCRECDGSCVFCLYCGEWSCMCSCMGSFRILSCRCYMFVSCVHHVAVLDAAFCMTFRLLILAEDARVVVNLQCKW